MEWWWLRNGEVRERVWSGPWGVWTGPREYKVVPGEYGVVRYELEVVRGSVEWSGGGRAGECGEWIECFTDSGPPLTPLWKTQTGTEQS